MHKQVEWLTVLAIEKQTGIPNATIRRYIRNHGHHLNIRKKGKSYSIADESISVMERIRSLYDEGKALEQVEEALIKAGTPVTVTVIEDDERMNINVGEALVSMDGRIDEQNKIIRSLVEQMQKQQETLQKQQEFITNTLEERDKRLIEVIRETQETKKQIAAANHPEEKRGWFARLFGK
jgi:DNA-binding transcriptional MerR regulator